MRNIIENYNDNGFNNLRFTIVDCLNYGDGLTAHETDDLLLEKKKCWIRTLVNNIMTLCSYHVTYAFQNESTLYSSLNIKELLARNRREIWCLSDCNGTRTHKQLVRKRTLNHLVKPFKPGHGLNSKHGLNWKKRCKPEKFIIT